MADNNDMLNTVSRYYERLPAGVIKFKDTNGFEIEYANDSFYTIIGNTADDFSGRFFEIIHESDVIYVKNSIDRKIKGESGPVEMRIITRKGFKWIRMAFFRDDDSSIWAMITDNTHAHELMKELNDERDRYRFAISCMTSVVYEYRFDKDVCKYYETSGELSENGENEIIRTVVNKYSKSIYADKVVHEAYIPLLLQISSGEDFEPFEIRQRKPWIENSEYEWYLVSGRVIRDKNGKPIKTIGTFTNINDRKMSEEHLIDKSRRDPVTQLYNRNAVVGFVSERMKQTDDGFLAVIGIDDLQKINDSYGHLYGDVVLSMFADCIKRTLKLSENDIVGRAGGGEFIVFISESDREKIEKRFDKFFENVSALKIETDNADTEQSLSCSVGIARRTLETPFYEVLFSHADKALYVSKQNNTLYSFYEDIKNSHSNVNGYLERLISDTGSKDIDEDEFDLSAACFEILDRTKNAKIAADMVLRQISASMNLERISIVERNGKRYSEQLFCERSECTALSIKDIEFIDRTTVKNIFVVEDEVVEQTRASGSNVKILCSRFDDKSDYSGMIILQRHGEYSDDDIRTIRNITNVLAVHLSKSKAIKEAEMRFDRLINYDELTGIPTLKKMRDMVEDFMKKNPDVPLLVINTDFYHFRYMNEYYGYEEGDKVLCEFSRFIEGLNGSEFYSYARISGDKFAAVMTVSSDLVYDQIEYSNKKFCGEINQRYPQANIVLRTGLYMLEAGEMFISALDKSDMARKSIQDVLASKCAYFDEKMSNRITLEAEMSRSMRGAVKNREFVVYFQPKVSLETYKIVGAEALVRWNRPDGSIMGPNAFVPYFEKNGFITNVDFCIYEQVMELMHEWEMMGIENVPVSLNMSRLHGRDIDIAERIKELMERYSISPNVIEFEITETALASCDSGLKKCLDVLHNMGVLINIDDFGSGYSSLNLLTEVPVDIIKLDRMMITESITSPKKAEVVRHTVNMARAIDCDVICEGVETYQEVEFLKSIGCTKVQGYYFSKPVESSIFRKMLEDNKPLR